MFNCLLRNENSRFVVNIKRPVVPYTINVIERQRDTDATLDWYRFRFRFSFFK